MPTFAASLRSFLSLSAALALAACTLPTKLADTSAGDETTDPSGTSGEPTTGGGGGGTIPINSGGADEGSSGAGSTAGASSGGGSACSEVQVIGKPLAPNVVLVLDKSGSMVSDTIGLWDHDDDPGTPDVTRWSSLHAVVEAIVTDFDDTINFGAHLAPNAAATAAYDANACVVDATVDIAVAAANKDAILAGIPAEGATNLRGGTPTSAAVTVALDHLKSLDPDVPRAILLVTDGAANCSAGASPPELFEVYDESIHTVVGEAFTVDGVPTYVVGVGIADVTSDVVQDGNPDDTNTFDRLNDLAVQGGKPKSDPSEKFFNTNNQIELAAALDQIAVDALTCLIPLETPPQNPLETVVEVDGTPVPHISDCANESGWVYTHPDGPFDAIELCGSACGGLKLVGQAELTVCLPD